MLALYRRHLAECPHQSMGRRYRRCKCPIWVQGTLGGAKVRRSLDLTSWEAAQQFVREWETRGSLSAEIVRIEDAVSAFLRDAEARAVRPGTVKNLRVLLDEVLAFARVERLQYLNHLDLGRVREFREAWTHAPATQVKKLERLRSFFRFCVDSGWLDTNPAAVLKPPRVQLQPTMPFSKDEVAAIIEACDRVPDNYGRVGGEPGRRLKALVLLLRYSGLRIGDAVTLPTKNLAGNRLQLHMQKTGVAVRVPLPRFVVDALAEVERPHPDYFFWTAESTPHTVTGKWRDRLGRLFKLARVSGGHPHRFRDTFAVELLEKGVPIEDVSVLLGHQNIRITQKHYAPWVKSRQQRLEERVMEAWE